MDGCPLPEDLIDYLEGRKEGDERQKLRDHISGCESCLDTIRGAFDVPGIEECQSQEEPEEWIERARTLIHARHENMRFVKLPGIDGRRHPRWPYLVELTKGERERYMKQVEQEAVARKAERTNRQEDKKKGSKFG